MPTTKLTQQLYDNGVDLTYGGVLVQLTVNLGKISYVSALGSDITGTKGRQDKPFKTIGAAVNASLSGDIIYVLPGTYNEIIYWNTSSNEHILHIILSHGVEINYTGNSADPVFSSSGFASIYIYGYGDIKRTSAVSGALLSNVHVFSVRDLYNNLGVIATGKWALRNFRNLEAAANCLNATTDAGFIIENFEKITVFAPSPANGVGLGSAGILCLNDSTIRNGKHIKCLNGPTFSRYSNSDYGGNFKLEDIDLIESTNAILGVNFQNLAARNVTFKNSWDNAGGHIWESHTTTLNAHLYNVFFICKNLSAFPVNHALTIRGDKIYRNVAYKTAPVYSYAFTTDFQDSTLTSFS